MDSSLSQKSPVELSRLLLRAAKDGQSAQVQALLSEGANPRVLDRAENTPLILAARSGHTEVVYTLFSTRPDIIDDINLDGYTALSVAAQYGHLNTVNTLLKYGAGLHELALLKAARHGKVEVVESLIRTGKVNLYTSDLNRNTPLMLAALHGHLPVVLKLIEVNLEVDQVNDEGNTAFMLAARYGHTAICEVLVTQTRANTQVVNLAGQTALQLAKTPGNSQGHIETVTTLAPESQEAEEDLVFILEKMTKMNMDMNHLDKENMPPAPVALTFDNWKKREATEYSECPLYPIDQVIQKNKKPRLVKSTVQKRPANKNDSCVKKAKFIKPNNKQTREFQEERFSEHKVQVREINTPSRGVSGTGLNKKRRFSKG